MANNTPTLRQSVRWGEEYVSRALNLKFGGILEAGVYHGFILKPAGSMSVLVEHSPEYPKSVAVVEREGYSLTVVMDDPGFVEIPASGDWHICIEAFYAPTQVGYQRIVARRELEPHHVLLGIVHADGESELTAETIDVSQRNNCLLPSDALQASYGKCLESMTHSIRLSDRLTKHELSCIEKNYHSQLQTELLQKAFEEQRLALFQEIAKFESENNARSRREAESAAIAIGTMDRMTRLELALLANWPAGGATVPLALPPWGYTTFSGAKVAPLTIVRPGVNPPAGAAIGLKLTEIETGA